MVTTVLLVLVLVSPFTSLKWISTGSGLPGQSSSQVVPLLSQFCDPLMLRRPGSFGVPV